MPRILIILALLLGLGPAAAEEAPGNLAGAAPAAPPLTQYELDSEVSQLQAELRAQRDLTELRINALQNEVAAGSDYIERLLLGFLLAGGLVVFVVLYTMNKQSGANNERMRNLIREADNALDTLHRFTDRPEAENFQVSRKLNRIMIKFRELESPSLPQKDLADIYAAAEDPTLPVALHIQAIALRSELSGDWAEAITQWERLLALDDSLPEILLHLAQNYKRLSEITDDHSVEHLRTTSLEYFQKYSMRTSIHTHSERELRKMGRITPVASSPAVSQPPAIAPPPARPAANPSLTRTLLSGSPPPAERPAPVIAPAAVQQVKDESSVRAQELIDGAQEKREAEAKDAAAAAAAAAKSKAAEIRAAKERAAAEERAQAEAEDRARIEAEERLAQARAKAAEEAKAEKERVRAEAAAAKKTKAEERERAKAEKKAAKKAKADAKAAERRAKEEAQAQAAEEKRAAAAVKEQEEKRQEEAARREEQARVAEAAAAQAETEAKAAESAAAAQTETEAKAAAEAAAAAQAETEAKAAAEVAAAAQAETEAKAAAEAAAAAQAETEAKAAAEAAAAAQAEAEAQAAQAAAKEQAQAQEAGTAAAGNGQAAEPDPAFAEVVVSNGGMPLETVHKSFKSRMDKASEYFGRFSQTRSRAEKKEWLQAAAEEFSQAAKYKYSHRMVQLWGSTLMEMGSFDSGSLTEHALAAAKVYQQGNEHFDNSFCSELALCYALAGKENECRQALEAGQSRSVLNPEIVMQMEGFDKYKDRPWFQDIAAKLGS